MKLSLSLPFAAFCLLSVGGQEDGEGDGGENQQKCDTHKYCCKNDCVGFPGNKNKKDDDGVPFCRKLDSSFPKLPTINTQQECEAIMFGGKKPDGTDNPPRPPGVTKDIKGTYCDDTNGKRCCFDDCKDTKGCLPVGRAPVNTEVCTELFGLSVCPKDTTKEKRRLDSDGDEGDEQMMMMMNAFCYGDPHFQTFPSDGGAGQKFDFHGQCDLVFADSPNFANGLGMAVHIR